MLAWQAGLAWCFIIGVIVLIGAFVGPKIRSLTATRCDARHARRAFRLRSSRCAPAFPDVGHTVDGLVCFAIVLIAWTANIRMPGGLPGGLMAVIVGSVIGWVVALIGWSDYVQPAAVGKSLEQFGLRIPLFSTDVWRGCRRSHRCS